MSQDMMFNILDSVGDDDLIPVVPVRGVSDPAKLGSATDGKYFAPVSAIGGGGSSSFESITSGADPIASNPNISFTIWTTGGTKGVEVVTLADPSDPTQPLIKTFQVKFTQGADIAHLDLASFSGFASNPVVITKDSSTSPISGLIELCWNPATAQWRALVGGPIITNGNTIDTDGGDVRAGLGDLVGDSLILNSGVISSNTGAVNLVSNTNLNTNGGNYENGADTGVTGTYTTITSITFTGGIVTAITGT